VSYKLYRPSEAVARIEARLANLRTRISELETENAGMAREGARLLYELNVERAGRADGERDF
jgi:hypothetical protein